MRLKPYDLGCLAPASYLIANKSTRNTASYRHNASTQDAHLCYVLPTYSHADVLAGHLERRDRLSARVRRTPLTLAARMAKTNKHDIGEHHDLHG
jgi:hypothetical protein